MQRDKPTSTSRIKGITAATQTASGIPDSVVLALEQNLPEMTSKILTAAKLQIIALALIHRIKESNETSTSKAES